MFLFCLKTPLTLLALIFGVCNTYTALALQGEYNDTPYTGTALEQIFLSISTPLDLAIKGKNICFSLKSVCNQISNIQMKWRFKKDYRLSFLLSIYRALNQDGQIKKKIVGSLSMVWNIL